MSGHLPPGCTQDECDRAQPGYYDDDYDYDGCDHEEYDIDVFEGRCRCYRCGESWWASEETILSAIDAQAAYSRWEDEQNRRDWWRDLWTRVTAPFRRLRRRGPPKSLDDEIPF